MVGLMASQDYFPINPAEKLAYDELWALAKPQDGTISGLPAVTFLQCSGIDVATLRSIWSLACPGLSMNVNQFYTALRFIAIAQKKPLPGGVTREVYLQTLSQDLGPPKFVFPQPVVPAAALLANAGSNPSQPVVQQTHIQSDAVQSPATVDVSLKDNPQYAMTPADHLKYHQLFLQYDTNKDGFLLEPEAVSVLSKSGVPADILQTVYSMADDDRDTRLSAKEFCLAFHLILCVMKRKLPMPPVLPSALRGFLDRAPATPLPAPIVVIAAPPTAATQSAPSPQHPAPTPQPAPQPAPQPQSTQPPGTGALDALQAEVEAQTVAQAVKTSVLEALKVGDAASEDLGKAASLLKQLLGKLNEQQVSLNASLNSAKKFGAEASASLEKVTRDITATAQQLSELQEQLTKQQSANVTIQSQLSERLQEKQALMHRVEEARKLVLNAADLQAAASKEGASIAADRAGVAAKEAAAREAFVEKRQTISLLEADVQALTALLSKLSTDKQTIDGKTSSISSDNAKAKQQLAKEQAALAKLQSELAASRKEEERLRGQVAALLGSTKTASPKPAYAVQQAAPLLSAADEDSDTEEGVDTPGFVRVNRGNSAGGSEMEFNFGEVYPVEESDNHMDNPNPTPKRGEDSYEVINDDNAPQGFADFPSGSDPFSDSTVEQPKTTSDGFDDLSPFGDSSAFGEVSDAFGNTAAVEGFGKSNPFGESAFGETTDEFGGSPFGGGAETDKTSGDFRDTSFTTGDNAFPEFDLPQREASANQGGFDSFDVNAVGSVNFDDIFNSPTKGAAQQDAFDTAFGDNPFDASFSQPAADGQFFDNNPFDSNAFGAFPDDGFGDAKPTTSDPW